MVTVTPAPLATSGTEALVALRRRWGWVLTLGMALIVVGGLACAFALTATLATVLALGSLMLVGGGFQLGSAVWARDWKGFFLFLLTGILYVVAGGLMIEHPVASAEGLTLMLAAAFLAGGLLRIIATLTHHFPGRGWLALNGAVTLALGVLIWRRWPVSGLWVIGLFAGIDLIVSGVACVLLAMAVRQALPRPE
jgi:uncharacterized membrane protein HdeD (DUF308 family)